jgi:hypothetical protein
MHVDCHPCVLSDNILVHIKADLLPSARGKPWQHDYTRYAVTMISVNLLYAASVGCVPAVTGCVGGCGRLTL